jgi:Flp pilus assembly protein TadD
MKAVAVAVVTVALLFGAGTAEELYRKAAKLFEQRRTAEAAGLLQQSLAVNPNQPAALKLLGLCHQLAGKDQEAEFAFIQATEVSPKDPDAWFFLGRQHYRTNFFEKALAALRTASGLAPQDHRIHTYLGLTLEAAGDVDGAVAAYKEAIRWNDGSPSFRPHYCYGALLAKLNRLEESEKQLRRAKSLDSSVWEVYFELAKLCHKQGKPAEAAAELNAALKADLVPSSEAGRFRNLLARVHVAEHDSDPEQVGRSTRRPPGGPPQFRDIAKEAGVEFVLDNHATPDKYQIETMPAGVAVLDYNNDGFEDLYFVSGAAIPGLLKTKPSYWNRLYRNEGNWRFTDVTEAAGVIGEGYSMAVAAADYDNDGWTDLFVAGVNRNILFRNNGDGAFANVTGKAGITQRNLWSISAGWFDYENDGDLDLFVVNYCKWSPKLDPYCGLPKEGYRSYCHPKHYEALPNVLYRNNGDGTFSDVSLEAGIAAHIGKGMGVAFADYNDDGLVDIFVANDTVPNFLFHNDGNGKFTEAGLRAGVALSEDGVALSSMGADFRDINNDGRPDIFVSALSNETFPLFRNTGKASFEDITYLSGLGFLSLPFGGFGAGIFDLNNDGWKDIFAAGSHVMDNEELFSSRASRQPNHIFTNLGGEKFAGTSSENLRFHRGAAFGDFDNDGRIDVAVSCLNEPAELLHNTSARSHWLQLELVGKASNRDGIGAKVRLIGASGFEQFNHVSTSVGYASSSTRRVHFGLGPDAVARRIEITWPGGAGQVLENIPADQLLTVRELTPQR